MKQTCLAVLLATASVLNACSSEGDRKSDVADDGGAQDASTTRSDSGLQGDIDAAADAAAQLWDGALGSGASDGGVPFVTNDAGQFQCGSAVCACSNGIDEDADGLLDQDDPECVSGWDNDEASFATGISGDNRDFACQDCFFDGNSGSGNDGCRVASSCLTTGAADGQGSCNTCEANDRCKNFCQAYTPNGCDCFGCCGVQLGSNITKHVLLGGSCSIDGNSLNGCTECVPSTTCVNTCGRCELCPGKTQVDLPADCAAAPADGGVVMGERDGGIVVPPVPTCDEGEASCGAGLPACTGGRGCTFGCCILIPLI